MGLARRDSFWRGSFWLPMSSVWIYSDGNAWTPKHGTWLRSHRFDQPALQMAYDSAFEAMLMKALRRNKLDQAIGLMAADSDFTPMVKRLGCLRGISTLTAFGLAVEIGYSHSLDGRRIGPPAP